VVRPDTVFYLAAGLYQQNRFDIEKMFSDPHFKLADWSNSEEVSLVFTDIVGKLRKVLTIEGATQVPLLLNPIWKTEGKTPTLADCCLDVFAWSTLGFLHFLIENGAASTTNRITRPMRTLVWVYVMLHDLATKGKTNFEDVIDRLSFNTKNDKAFSASGSITHKYMKSDNLRTPRIKRQEISNIIFGGGQKLLSPERRFDAIIVNSPELFR
jgi:type II restriction enzyme